MVSVILLILLILATIFFIFSRSTRDMLESHLESLLVSEWLTPILEVFLGKGRVTEHLIRKLAHFCEFGLLGAEGAVFTRLLSCRNPIYALFFSLFCALTDETIQIFSGRGSQVKDIWLDFFGAACGIFGIFLICRIFRRKK